MSNLHVDHKRRGCRLVSWVVVAAVAFGACGSDGDRPEITTSTGATGSTTTVAGAGSTTETTEGTTTTRPPITTTTRAPITTTTRPPRTTTTDEPTTTAAPDTSTTEVAAGPTDATDDDETTWWPWLLGALAVIGLIAYFASRGARRAAKWRQEATAALDETTRLAMHLAAVAPEGAAMVAGQDAGQLAQLGARLSALGVEAKEVAAQQAITSVRDQVQVLHGVVDGIAMGSTPASPTTLAYLHEQATALHGVAERARAAVAPTATSAGTATGG